MKWFIALILFLPSICVAEVSDKMPSIIHIIVQGILISVGLFFAGFFRWWLGLLFSPIFIIFILGTIALWNDVPMREALIHEQGGKYFGAIIFQNILIGISIVTGAIIGYKRKK